MKAKQYLVNIAMSIAKAQAEVEEALELSGEEGTEHIAEELEKALNALRAAMEQNMGTERRYSDEVGRA